MKFLGWITLFLLGLAIINTIAYRVRTAEKIAFALPMGMGANSLIFFLAEIFHFPLTSIKTFIGLELAMILILSVLTIRKEKPKLSPRNMIEGIDLKKLLPVNLSLVFFIGVISVVTYILIRKSLYWPIAQFDSITGFDFVAKAIVQEGTLNNSIFSKTDPLYTIRSIYPPLVPFNFAFAYLIGHSSSQIVVLLLFLSTLLSFYLLLQRTTNHLCAAFFTMLLVITPEYAAFSTISSSNIPCAFYASIGMLCLLIWISEENNSYLLIGTIFIALAIWTRSEAIVFAAAGGLLILLSAIKNKKKLPLILFISASIAALLLWQWYIRAFLNISSAQPVPDTVSWDPEKLSRMLTQIKRVTFSTQYYGATVLLFLAMILINIKNIAVRRDNGILLLSIFTAYLLYVVVFYLIDTDYLSNSMEGWIFSGYKRGLFCFFPLMLYYCGTNKVTRKLFDQYLNLSPDK